MAKLQSYYVLCPLIDQKSFLGISEDREDETVIVTLGRNVVNKYRLTDQKQTGGWTSKDHITAPVIYNKQNNSYVGVFNNNTIKMWKEDSDNLDKVKKYKFPLQIHRVLPHLVVFANGNCASLTYAIENRKSYDGKAAIKDSEEIVAVQTFSGKWNICYVVKSNSEYQIIQCPLRVELGDLDKSKLSRVKVTRPDVYVVGQLIHAAEKTIYILWSDSKMTAYNLQTRTWKTVGTVPWVSTADRVSLMWMGHNHIVVFGSNSDRDGAIIVAYNVVLSIGSCRYPMKMYTADAKLFCFDDRIILEASNHIGLLPYVVEEKRHLSSLLGSHEIVEDDCLEIADWGTPTILPFQVSKDTEKLLKQGLSERTICAKVVSNIIEEPNVDCERITEVLKDFKDVPESVVVLLINHVMKEINVNSVASVSDRDVDASSVSDRDVDASSVSDRDVDASSVSDRDVAASSVSDRVVDASSVSDRVVDASSVSDMVVDAPSGSDRVVDASTVSDRVVDASSVSDRVVDASTVSDRVVDAPSVSDRVVAAFSEYVSEFNLLDYLLDITVSDSLLITHLRSSMSLDNALFLIAYIACLLKTGNSVVDEPKLLDWCMVLMDAFYPQYLMTKDAKVTKVLRQTLQVIKDLIQDLGLVNSTIAVMHKVLYSKNVETSEDLPYSIEFMEI